LRPRYRSPHTAAELLSHPLLRLDSLAQTRLSAIDHQATRAVELSAFRLA
jgi:hypothetical protein